VPFGRQRLIGILVGVVAETTVPLHKLKAALEFLDERPVFDPVTFELLRWAADYYHHPIGEVYAAALPAALRSGLPTAVSTEHWSLTARGREELESPSSRRAPQQRALLSWLADRTDATADEAGESFKASLLKNLAARGWIAARVTEATSVFDSDASRARRTRRTRTDPALSAKRSRVFSLRCRHSACICWTA